MCHSDWKCTLREETCVYKQFDTQKKDCAFLPDGLRLPVVMIYDCCLATITKKIHVVVSKKKKKEIKKIITLVCLVALNPSSFCA